MKKIELLSPAGNMESLIAAIEAGCDAVYLGGYMFGARSFANNFSNEELIEAIKYAHLYGVKIYVTTNTLIYEEEVETFMNYIEFLHKNNVDAIIIQDIGMFDLIRKTYPNLEIHISTQMHIHNLEGALLMKELGASRVVLARETSIERIKEIKEKANIEIEVFGHGALCISYSGQCLMSSLIGNRSGNRGTCAGICRQKYDLITDNKKINEEEYLLSTKDLFTLDKIKELIESGIDSLKIEGRMKRPEYVYLVVSLYRKAIDSYYEKGIIEITESDIKDLKKIFNREFTKGFLFNEENKKITNSKRPNHMGIEVGEVIDYYNNKIKIKLTDDVSIHDGLRIVGMDDYGIILNEFKVNDNLVKEAKKGDIISLKVREPIIVHSKVLKTTDYKQTESIKNMINSKSRKVLIDIKFEAKINEKPTLTLTDDKNIITIKNDFIVDKAINNPVPKERIIEQLNKLGDTIYKTNDIKIDIDDSIFIPIKILNDMKKEAVYSLNKKRLYKIKYEKKEYNIDVREFDTTNKKIAFIKKEEQYNLVKDKFDEIYIDNELLFQKIKSDKIIFKLPRVIEKYNELNQLLVVAELGSIYKYKNIYTDFSLNVTNSYTVALLHSLGSKRVTLSYELDNNQIKNIIDAYNNRYHKHPSLELIIYGKEEVMVSKFNLLDKCNVDKNSYLRDRFNNLYPIRVKDDLMYIYNYKERRMNNPEFYFNLGINAVRYNLLDEET